MRVAWFTPFTRHSAIGRCSQVIARELARFCEVDIWAAEPHADLLATELTVRGFGLDHPFRQAHEYDQIVYNLGNHMGNHRDIYYACQQSPGIVVLHDFVMHHFFAGYCRWIKYNSEGYLTIMEASYGRRGRDIALATLAGERSDVWNSDEVGQYPLFEPALTGARGVVTHSRFHARHVERVFIGPQCTVPLPLAPHDEHPAPRESLDLPAGKAVLLTVGDVNPNKRIDKVIEALGADKDLASRVLYVVIGSVDRKYATYLRQLIRRCRLDKGVRLLGRQPDDVLQAYLQAADVCINLRFPTTEGASASLLEQMHQGKPVIVTNSGTFADYPDDCVRKICHENEATELKTALRELVGDSAAASAMGRRAREYVLANCTARRYAEALWEFFPQVDQWRCSLGLMDRVGRELRGMGVSGDMEIVDKAAVQASLLFSAAGNGIESAEHSP
ncbi:MAG: glycosyltransferase family 4 protein [Phycisphaerae bacterium]